MLYLPVKMFGMFVFQLKHLNTLEGSNAIWKVGKTVFASRRYVNVYSLCIKMYINKQHVKVSAYYVFVYIFLNNLGKSTFPKQLDPLVAVPDGGSTVAKTGSKTGVHTQKRTVNLRA